MEGCQVGVAYASLADLNFSSHNCLFSLAVLLFCSFYHGVVLHNRPDPKLGQTSSKQTSSYPIFSPVSFKEIVFSIYLMQGTPYLQFVTFQAAAMWAVVSIPDASNVACTSASASCCLLIALCFRSACAANPPGGFRLCLSSRTSNIFRFSGLSFGNTSSLICGFSRNKYLIKFPM